MQHQSSEQHEADSQRNVLSHGAYPSPNPRRHACRDIIAGMTTRRLLVTGGSQGIGEALVDQARAAGHDVTFTGRDQTRVETVAARTGAHGVVADVARGDDNARTVDEALTRMGGIDVLINNAGYAYRAEIGALDVDAMRAMFETNVFGLVDLTNRVVPHMKTQAFGDIVNLASTSGMKGAATATPYSASKWAVRGITQCWQAELRPHGIRVTCICPSEVQTNFGGRTGRNNPNKLYAEDIAATIMAGIGLPQRVLWTELAIFATNPWKED
jgi:3-oxoacyl-[acyl-carrier protein] reductase